MSTDRRCLIGLDVGTTSVKAIAVDLEGNLLAGARAPLPLHSPARHHYIQDADEMREAIFQVLQIVSMQLGSCRVEALGITGQSISPIVADRNGRPLHPIISHLDSRSLPLVDMLSERVGPLGYVGVKLFANLVWIRREKPEIWRSIGMVLDVKEYAGYLLTGQPSCDRIWYQIEDVGRYCKELEIPAEWLGPAKVFTEVLGQITMESSRRTGLPSGTPVIVSLGDSLVSPYGSGVVREGDMADVCGATEIMSVAAREVHGVLAYPYMLNGLKITSHSPPIGLMHKWLVEMLAEISGVETAKAYHLIEEMAVKAGPGAGAVIFLPGSFKTVPKMINTGLTHLTYHNSFKQLVRAFYECTAFELKHTVETFEAAGARISRVIVSGGAATPFLCQLKADVLEMDVETPKIMETGCMGAALTAGYAVGLYHSLDEAVSVVKVGRVYHRSGDYDYGERYRQYLEVRRGCGGLL
ncbi:MAG: FGGY family carbohydrate kinase [Nitrososphaerota archaeon]